MFKTLLALLAVSGLVLATPVLAQGGYGDQHDGSSMGDQHPGGDQQWTITTWMAANTWMGTVTTAAVTWMVTVTTGTMAE